MSLSKKVQNLFKTFNCTFKLISSIKNQSMRQNKLKQLEGEYRRFQKVSVQLNTQEKLKQQQKQLLKIKNLHKNESDLSSFDKKSKDQKYRLQQMLIQGNINFYQIKAKRLQKIIKGTKGLELDENLTDKKINPYGKRSQNFQFNQKRRFKISIKQFVE